MASRCSGLLLSRSADAHSSDDVVAFEGVAPDVCSRHINCKAALGKQRTNERRRRQQQHPESGVAAGAGWQRGVCRGAIHQDKGRLTVHRG